MADLLVAEGAPTTALAADAEQQQLEPNDDALRPVLQNIVASSLSRTMMRCGRCCRTS